jgi:signal transduction histidine kinase
MTDALRLQWASELTATTKAKDDRNRTPLFYQLRSNIVIAVTLLQLAKTSLRLNKPANEDALAKAEKAYQKSVGYVELLPEEDRTSALFDLGKLRAALDEFRSAQAGSQDS